MEKESFQLPEREIIERSNLNSDSYEQGLDLSEVFHRGGPSRRSGLKLAIWTMASFMVDALVIIGLTLSFILISSLLTKLVIPKNFITQKNLVEVLMVAGLGISWIYYLALRMIVGATVGEFSCGLRVGQPFERLQSSYALRILFRLTLIAVTGFIVLPILSILFKKDLVGKLTKVSLYSLK